MSCFGRLESGVFASLGYSGVGIPRGTISGKLLAEYALGFESELITDIQAVSGPQRLPPEAVSRSRGFVRGWPGIAGVVGLNGRVLIEDSGH